MSNLENQTKQFDKNAVTIHSTIFKLVETIEKKIKAGHTDKDLEELKQLRDHCGSDNPLVSVTACHGLVYLVKAGFFPLLSNTVSALVASLFSVKSVTGVSSALTQLLVLELKSQLGSDSAYTCPYNTRSPQHPLVSVLKRRPLAWPDVLNQVSTVCSNPDKQVQSHSLEVVRPVLVYVLMENNDLPDSCRYQAFTIIINHFSNTDFLVEALASCLCWNESRVLGAVQVVSSIAQSAVNSKNGLQVSLCCLVLTALISRLLQAALSPQPALSLLSQLINSAPNTHSTILVLLADSTPTCPPVYLEYLLNFVVELLRCGQCSLDCVWMYVASILPWLACSSSYLPKALHNASLIVSHASAATASANTTAALIANSATSTIISADHKLTQALHIARVSEELRGESASTLQWLQKQGVVRLDLVHRYVSALVLSRNDAEVRVAALKVLTASEAPSALATNLTLLLYQLAREREPRVHLALLQALPSTAVDKGNVMGVVSTLEALRRSGHKGLSLLAVDLYSQLWACQERCYPQLMDILGQDLSKHDPEPWIAHLLRANICKAICDAKPEMHGKEVVAHISDILNKCGGVKETAASAVAIEALIPLCRHDVVDVFSIWRSLSPRFSRDKRPPVLSSLCELVSVAAVQKPTNSDAEDAVIQIIKWLWNLIALNKNKTVVSDALKALSKFRLDQMTLKMIPECFRRGVKLPPEMTKTPVDAARKPEDVLNYIPSECWVQVLQHVDSEAASLAVANWIKIEVTSFRSNLYQVDRQEPAEYARLGPSSVVCGVTTSLKQLCANPTPDNLKVANWCLLALLQPTPKPLPSLSWNFLNNVYDTSLTKNIVHLAAKQSQISPSSRKITETYINRSEKDREKIEFLYSILGDLCRGIPPNTLRPFLERTLHSALAEKDNKQFEMMMKYIKTTLKEEKIHDANRTLIQQQVKGLWDLIEPQYEMLNEYFDCVSELPVSVIESMSSTSLMWEVTSAQLQKAFRLRVHMALVPNATAPLNWINEIIEVSSTNISEQALALQLVEQVVNHVKRHPSAWPWLQELMGQTHITSTSKNDGVEFLVTVFILCVDILSDFSCLSSNPKDSRALRFPQAVASLVSQYGEAKSMLEWLNHMKGVEKFPEQYISPFQLAARNVLLILG